MTHLKTIFSIVGGGLLAGSILQGCGNDRGGESLYRYANEAMETGEGYRMVDPKNVFCKIERDGHAELVESQTQTFLLSSVNTAGLAVNPNSHKCYLITGTKKGVLGFQMTDPYGYYNRAP